MEMGDSDGAKRKKKKTVIEQTACKYEQTANDHQVSNKRHFNSAKRIMNMQNLKYHRKT